MQISDIEKFLVHSDASRRNQVDCVLCAVKYARMTDMASAQSAESFTLWGLHTMQNTTEMPTLQPTYFAKGRLRLD